MIIQDNTTGQLYAVAIEGKRFKLIPVTEGEVSAIGDRLFTDTVTGVTYEIQSEDGQLLLHPTTAPSAHAGLLVVGTNSWASWQEAEDYFATRFGVGTNWSALTDANKIAALISAYRQLINCSDFTIAADDVTDVVKNAQCEMALFLIIHQTDMDARKGLQAQGVTQAGIVGETYDKDMASRAAVPAMIRSMLTDYESGSPLLQADAERDDEE
jgi:hypothetical protein